MSIPAEHRRYSPKDLGYGVVTVSSSRTLETDTGGRKIRRMVEAAGQRVVESLIVPDSVAEIRNTVRGLLSQEEVDVVVLTGGTGFSPRDVTLEAITPLFERPVDGFGELFRVLSYEQVGAAAMLSRAAAGTVAGRAIFALPGSPKAVELAMEKLVLPEASHLIGQLRREG